MSDFSQARRLLESIGPGRLLVVGPHVDPLALELRRLGCAAVCAPPESILAGQRPEGSAGFDAVIWTWDGGGRIPSPEAMATLTAGAGRVFALVRDPAQTAPEAPVIQRAALASGWRRSLCDWSVNHYRELDHPGAWSELYLEPLPSGRSEPLPPAGLLDPTRDPGPLADALLARYALAAELVRPGDHVLVVGGGSGAGAALLAQRSRCAAVTLVDAAPAHVAYARRHFGAGALVRAEIASPGRLAPLADRSIDIVVAVDLLDHLADHEAAMAEFGRVLKPDGRVVASAFDEPVPAGLGGQAMQGLLGERFLIEAQHRQPVPDDRGSPRTFDRIALADEVPAGGWRVVMASANPIDAEPGGFVLPEFARLGGPPVPVTDFASHYANPWLYRPMVQMGQRLQDEALLTDFALAVMGRADPTSADMGAALCVLAYQVLGRRLTDQVDNLLPLIDAYAAQDAANPHVLRWQISLEFAAALGCLTTGALARAEGYFEAVTRRDPLAFSPLLSTKVVAAAFWLGIRRLVEREPVPARAWFQAGVRAAARALQAPIEGSISSLERPNTFGFQELAEVADMASQCAQALEAIDVFAVAPGRFWRQVDTRRFGLATWLLHLERENRELRQQLQAATPA